MKFEVRKTALQNKLTLNSFSSNGKQTAEWLLIYQAILSLFYSFFKPILDFLKMFIGSGDQYE